jgi:hypothetical protein
MKRKLLLVGLAIFCVLAGIVLAGNNAQAAPDPTLVISVSRTSATIPVDERATMAYTVKRNGVAVEGYWVQLTLSGKGDLVSDHCVTDTSGKCQVDFVPRFDSSTATVSAIAYTNSTLEGIYSNEVTTSITISSGCPTGANLNFGKTTYKAGDTISIEGMYPTAVFSLCLYNPSGSNVAKKENNPVMSTKQTVSAPATEGTWTGILQTGLTCPTLSAAGGCQKTLVVDAAASSSTGGTSSGGSTSSKGWQCSGGNAVEDVSGKTISCSDATLCPTGKGACGTECSTGSSVYCLTSQKACTCDNTADAPAPSIATCDTNAWLFCNPLKGTIDNIMDAGTKSAQALLGLIGTIALLFLVIAGITYMTAAGDEEKIKSAKKIITGTVIGFGLTLISFSLLQAVLKILDSK